jgi:acetoin utilization protein AcuB
MRVSRFMTDKVITVRPGEGLRATFFKMREHGIRHLPVVDDKNQLVGILSDRDLRRPDWVDEAPDIAHIYRLDDDLQVEDVMTDQVVVTHTYEPVLSAAALLEKHRFGALPVLNKDEALVGMLSAHDLLGLLTQLLAEIDD